MAPEQDAPSGAFYDHESSESAPRRRRAAADWGVGEDIFDRMPSRRLTRADRRAEHHEDLEVGRFERRLSGPATPRAAPRRLGRRPRAPPGRAAPRRLGPCRRAPSRTPSRRVLDRGDEHIEPVEGKRQIDSWLEPERGHELTLSPGESRTIVLETGTPLEPELAPERAGAPHRRDQRPSRPAAGRAHAASAPHRRRAHRRTPGPDRRLRRAAGFRARVDRDSHDRPINRGASPCGAPRADIPLSLVSQPPSSPTVVALCLRQR